MNGERVGKACRAARGCMPLRSLTGLLARSVSPGQKTSLRWTPLIRTGCALLLGLACIQARADVQYIHDPAGRLIQVVAPDGSSAVYAYDAGGNILSISRLASGQLALTTTSATSGSAGSQITIDGSGFSTIPSDDVVSFDGLEATVVSATGNQLVVDVPAGASTGAISVTVNGNTVTTPQPFIIAAAPGISDFSPAIANTGETITVSGTNLDPQPNGTLVSVGATGEQPTSVSADQVTFSAQRSGKITISTPNGRAVSATDLLTLPTSIPTGSIASSAVLTANGSAEGLTISQSNGFAVYSFDASGGLYLSLQVNSLVTTPGGAAVSYQVYSPSDRLLSSGSVGSTFPSIYLSNLPTGTYVVAFDSGNSTSAQLSAKLEIDPALTINGPALATSASAPAQSKWFEFSATAGESLGLGLTSMTLSPSTPNTFLYPYVYAPNGSMIADPNCYTTNAGDACNVTLYNLPQTGTYTVRVDSPPTQAMSFGIVGTQAVAETLALNTPQSVSLSTPGQPGLLSFTATAGQNAAIDVSSISTSPANQSIAATVYGPSGTYVGAGSGSSPFTINLTNLAAGTYQVLIAPSYGATATLQAELGESTTQAVPLDGTTTNYSISVPGESVYYTFSAAAGQSIGIGLTGLTLSPGSPNYIGTNLTGPSATSMAQPNCYTSNPGASCGLYVFNATQAGTYTLKLQPATQQTGSFSLTASQPVTATLTPNTPQSVSLSAPGQPGLLSFTATAGQNAAIDVSSISTSPANQSIAATVYGPSGTYVGAGSGSSPFTINLTNLAAGTYQVLIAPSYGATATLQAELGESTTQAVPLDGTTTNYSISVPGESVYYTFSAAAGQSIGIGLTGLTLSPGSPNYIGTNLTGPSATSMAQPNCYTSNPGASCGLYVFNATQAGTYTLKLQPATQQTGSFSLTASQPVTATLTPNTPQSVSLSAPGQLGLLSFTATAGQNAAIDVSSISTSPANQSIAATVYGPSGTYVGAGSGSSPFTINLTNLAAGTYQVLIAPSYGATATLQAELGESTTQAVPLDGTTTNYSISVPGESVYYTFSAAAGQSIGIGLTGLTLSPGSPNYIGTNLTGPSATSMAQPNCYTSNPGASCGLYVFNATQAGTYTLKLQPATQQTGSFSLTASQPVTATLTPNTPQSVSLSAPGQLGLLSFTATAGQNAAIDVSSISTSPANQSIAATVYGPSGTYVGAGSGSSPFTINLTNLAAGTYQLLIAPSYGATATATVDVSN